VEELHKAKEVIYTKLLKNWIIEGLNGVNRQPSNGQKINRQPSKTEYFYRQMSEPKLAVKIFFNFFFTFFKQFFLIIF